MNPRLSVIPPQPQGQNGELFQAPVPTQATQELATLSSLQANVTSAVSTSGWAFTAMGIVYRCGEVTFSTNAGIAAGVALWQLTFQHPFKNVPIVLCGGGDNCVAALLAANKTATNCFMFGATAIANQAGQKMQWIAIGV